MGTAGMTGQTLTVPEISRILTVLLSSCRTREAKIS